MTDQVQQLDTVAVSVLDALRTIRDGKFNGTDERNFMSRLYELAGDEAASLGDQLNLVRLSFGPSVDQSFARWNV